MDSGIEHPSEHLRNAIDDELKSLDNSARALKLRRNVLAPISRLPPEVTTIIFSFLSLPNYVRITTGDDQNSLSWLRVAHVCHRWREIALNQPHFWSLINFNALTLAGATEVLSRSKMAPLKLEANLSRAYWTGARFNAFRKQLTAHVSHTRHLNIIAKSGDLQTTIDELASPAPILEWLSLIGELDLRVKARIPPDLFDGTAPRLSCLQLDHCDISWTSPLLRGLKNLDLRYPSSSTLPSFVEWLDAMDQMLQLETLVLSFAIPSGPPAVTISEPTRVVTCPSLTKLHLEAYASDCALALAHLVLPALSTLQVEVSSELSGAEDVQALIPYFSRNAHGPQDAKPLQSILISGDPSLTEVIVWTEPDAEVDVRNPVTLNSATLSARAIFIAAGDSWIGRLGTDTEILDATLAALPLSSLSTLTAQNSYHFPESLWVDHAPRWPLLDRVCLADAHARKSLTNVLARDMPHEDPLLPSLTKLSLISISFIDDASHLLNMLIGRVEQGVPLEALDLRGCIVDRSEIKLLGEIVADVQGPELLFLSMARWPTLFHLSRDMGLLQGGVDEDDESDEDEEAFDALLSLSFNGYYNDEYGDGDGEEDGEEEEEEELE